MIKIGEQLSEVIGFRVELGIKGTKLIFYKLMLKINTAGKLWRKAKCWRAQFFKIKKSIKNKYKIQEKMVKDRKRRSDILATKISEGKIQMNGTGHSILKKLSWNKEYSFEITHKKTLT